MKTAVLVAVLAALVIASSAAAATPTDPRVCVTSTGQPVEKLRCAKADASLAFRRYMQTRFRSRYLWQGGLTCRGFAGYLRFSCSFWNYGMNGVALVDLGKPPAWKPTVTLKSMVCTAQPERQGCP